MEFIKPDSQSSIIKVIGVGGGGGNAVKHMYNLGIEGVDFIVCNTDSQALEGSPVPQKYQLGEVLTEGLGAGADPDKGKKAAIESIEDIQRLLSANTKMVFITAGMGGGTGTGAAPIIAKAAKDLGILTVGIVTTPFNFEGRKRMNRANEGIDRMKESVDSLLVINNEKLRDIFGNLEISKAFEHADNILATAAKSIAEIITFEGYINVDFQDVKTVMANSGVALMGTAIAEGEDRATKAAKEALSSPLLAENDIAGAKHILLNITSGTKEITMDEVTLITDVVLNEAGEEADVIWGNAVHQGFGEKISVTIIATAFEGKKRKKENHQTKVPEFEIEPTDSTPNEILDNLNSNEQSDDDDSLPYELPASYHLSKKTYSESLGIAPDGKKTTKDKEIDLDELEKIPAYIRKNIKLNQSNNLKSETEVSRFTLSDEESEKPELRKNNRFLHDNVD